MDTKNIKNAIRPRQDSAAGNIAKGVGAQDVSAPAMPFADFKKMVQEYADLEKIVFPPSRTESGLLRDRVAEHVAGKSSGRGMSPEQIDIHQRMLDIYSRVPKHQQELFDKMLNEIKANG